MKQEEVKQEEVKPEVAIQPVVKEEEKNICPGCGKVIDNHKCRFCGAVKTINQVSGNVIWMRNGRIVAAFQDERNAWIKMAQNYQIPESEWPEKFKTGGKK